MKLDETLKFFDVGELIHARRIYGKNVFDRVTANGQKLGVTQELIFEFIDRLFDRKDTEPIRTLA